MKYLKSDFVKKEIYEIERNFEASAVVTIVVVAIVIVLIVMK